MTLKTNSKGLLVHVMLALILAMAFHQAVAFAQTSFDIPTLLPAQNENLGGEGDTCIGLADMIRSGDIHLRNIPCFVKYFSQMLITVAGSLSVLFVMIGGYTYVLGKDESKDKAKKTITYALIGLAVSLLAWIIVDIVLQVATE